MACGVGDTVVQNTLLLQVHGTKTALPETTSCGTRCNRAEEIIDALLHGGFVTPTIMGAGESDAARDQRGARARSACWRTTRPRARTASSCRAGSPARWRRLAAARQLQPIWSQISEKVVRFEDSLERSRDARRAWPATLEQNTSLTSRGHKHRWSPALIMKKASTTVANLKGLLDKIDYIQGLGTTSIWLTPSFKNKAVQPEDKSAGYHGEQYENDEVDEQNPTESAAHVMMPPAERSTNVADHGDAREF